MISSCAWRGELATRFHDAAAAETAIAGWHAAVTGQGDTSLLPLQEVQVPAEGLRIAALLTAAGITPSNSEANRKLRERAVKVDGAVVDDAGLVFAPGFEGVLQVGKRNFARVRLAGLTEEGRLHLSQLAPPGRNLPCLNRRAA